MTLVGLGWARGFAARFSHLVDGFLELPGFPGLPETEPREAELPAFLAAARGRDFDLAVQLHGSGRVTNGLVAELGARRTAGFHPPGEPPPDRMRFLPWPERGHEIHRLLSLPEHLGLPLAGDGLEFPLGERDAAEADRIAHGLERGGYACVHPGARSAEPWPADRFAAVADALAAKGLEVVLTGSHGERPLTAAVAGRMRAPARDVAGATSLGALGALLAGARILVSNDTGVSHIAAALRLPSVVVVTSSDPDRWTPLDRALHRVVARPAAAAPVVAEAAALLAPAPAAA